MHGLILVAALISQWDMRPVDSRWTMTPQASASVQPASWSMTPRSPSTADIAKQQDQDLQERLCNLFDNIDKATANSSTASPTPLKPVVDLFAPYWSPKSAKAIEEIRQMQADFTVVIHYDDTTFPQWVRDRASTKEGGGYPLVWYAVDGGKAKVMEWTGPSDFCLAYELTTAPEPILSQRDGGYPVHRQRWNIEGKWNPSRATVIEHLSSAQHHAGKWDLGWLQSLNTAELLSLHDDDHEDRVRREYVRQTSPVHPPVASPVIARTVPVPRVMTSSCPGGRCPTATFVRRKGIIGRLLL